MNPSYEQLFAVNWGLLSEDEIKKIRNTRVFVCGCGGVGGSVSIILARTGVEHFTLADPEDYEPSNTNRQIACFADTLGKNKAEVIASEIRRINPGVEVRALKKLSPRGVTKIVKEADVVIPAADDFAWSIVVARKAAESGKPVVIGYPTGLLGRVTVIPPGKQVERYFGLPPGLPYRLLRRLINSSRLRRRFRAQLEFYKKEGHWREDWFERFLRGEVSLPQICPVVWLTASLVALEVIKLVTGRFKTVEAPAHWYVTPTGISIKNFEPPQIQWRKFIGL